MTPLDNTKETLSAMAGAAGHLRQAIPPRLITITLGVFGTGLALGTLIGALGYRALAPNRGRPRYESWTRAKLHDLAADKNIEGRSTMSKDELVDAIRAAS